MPGPIARGLTNKEIAAQVIAPGTARRHRINIHSKPIVGNRAAATARADESGLIA